MKNTLHVGDHVDLIANGEVVGQGLIHCWDPSATCKFIKLRYNRVSLVMDKAIKSPSFPLPYPTINASTIEQAQGSFVLWNRNDVSHYKHGIAYMKHDKERKRDIGWVMRRSIYVSLTLKR